MDKKKFIKYDKYHGRSLDRQGVRKTLHHFFHNGREPRSDIILTILEKLKDLISVIENQKSFIFLSCSLLLVYDSSDPSAATDQVIMTDSLNEPTSASALAEDKECTSCDNSVDVRIIDFANTVRRDQISTSDVNPDGGILFGLKNLVKILEVN